MTQTIEQLTARVRELETQLAANNPLLDEAANRIDELDEENARLKAESRDASLGLNDYYGRKLAAEQLNIKLLREALDDTFSFLERHSNRWDGINGKHPQAVAEAARAALSLPASTEELDKYVEEKVKGVQRNASGFAELYLERGERIHHLTRQRDLAVEALKSCGVNDGLNGPTQYFDEDLVERAIKESEAK